MNEFLDKVGVYSRIIKSQYDDLFILISKLSGLLGHNVKADLDGTADAVLAMQQNGEINETLNDELAYVLSKYPDLLPNIVFDQGGIHEEAFLESLKKHESLMRLVLSDVAMELSIRYKDRIDSENEEILRKTLQN